ncbi:CD276 antigen-like [Rhinichthys klamathensis goyatoka]|uniref:CD276 antigen-like n=1 Tax=Rhinichthys klamathensis goyatoka TaxID=3034132 RepID=UPI0024B56096|nr:CD276 antigen-like [Rhinichthys klamathensis goyatoka]XP_056116605.1 CD276 antigen-like [Rhinichthys klamathensis goyatoka]
MEFCQKNGNVRRRGLFYFLLVFLLINEVSLQETVEGFIGGSAVLPCSSEEHQLKLQDITVQWRHNRLSVYHIIEGKDSVEAQDPAYKNRTETFPEEYLNGNFSLKLYNLQHTDAGKYTCFITQDSVLKSVQNVELLIKERQKIHRTKNANEGSNQKPEMIVMIISTLCIGIIFYLSCKYI